MQSLRGQTKSIMVFSEVASLACMFCFPISDNVMLLEGIVSFKCRANVRMHVQMYV